MTARACGTPLERCGCWARFCRHHPAPSSSELISRGMSSSATGLSAVCMAMLLTAASRLEVKQQQSEDAMQQGRGPKTQRSHLPCWRCTSQPAPAERWCGGCQAGLGAGQAGSRLHPVSLRSPAGLRRPTDPQRGGSCRCAAWQRLLPAETPPVGLQHI